MVPSNQSPHRSRRCAFALMAALTVATVTVLAPNATPALAQTNAPGGTDQPADNPGGPTAAVPQNESGTVPGGASTGGGAAAPETDDPATGSPSKVPQMIMVGLVAVVAAGFFVAQRERRLREAGVR